ncbi:MAG: YihY/virulence factor BrkB family protein, partial [Candidatus Nanopelagicales bacterium]|nr:YihY/virulence factor BrkB family protein [Candidatus Nanopelagicales bacterium]
MRSYVKGLARTGMSTFTEYSLHRGSLASGGMAYFVLLAIAPAAVFIGAVAGAIVGPEDTRAAIESLLVRAPELGSEFQPTVDALLTVMTTASGSAVTVTSIVSLLIAIYAASKAIMALRLALDASFEFTGVRHGLLGRVRDAVLTLIGLLVIVTLMLVLTLLPRVLRWLGITDFRATTGVGWADWLLFAVLIWALLLALYHWVPSRSAPVTWRSPVLLLVTAWLLAVSAGVGAYVGFSSTIGAAIAAFGAPMVLLLWLYLSFMGVLLG